MIRIEQTQLTAAEEKSLQNLDQFKWVIFTSKNGVVSFFKQMIETLGNTTLPTDLKIAVIGKNTAAELDYYGYAPYFTANENTSDGLLKELQKKHHLQNQNILLALGNLAGDKLETELSKANSVTRINTYQTEKPAEADPKLLDAISNDNYDLIVFTSPSTFHNFFHFYGTENISKVKMASIGEVTSEAIRQGGAEPLLTAASSNAEGLYKAIIDYYQTK
jgi:uroporphyrinogen-III synthase